MHQKRFMTHTTFVTRLLILLATLLLVSTPVAAQDIQCTAIHPTAITATPSEFITLENIPTDWLSNTVFATVATPNTTEQMPVYVEILETGVAEFIVPLHPDDPMGGGVAELTIYNVEFGEECDVVELTITPLTRVPEGKTLLVLGEALGQVLAEQMQFFGYSDTNLANIDPGEDPFGYTLAAALAMLRNGTLQEFMLETAITADGESPELMHELMHELGDALAYTSGFTDAMFEFLDAFSTLPDLPMNAAGAQPHQHVQSMGLAPPLPQSISTPEELDWWMEARTYCTMWNEHWLAAPRAIVGGMLSAASAVPGTQLITAPALLHLTISQITIDVCSNVLPHRLVAFEVEASPGLHNEDDPQATGRWSATLTATGIPYTLNWPTVIGAMPGLGAAGKVITKLGGQIARTAARHQPLAGWIQGILLDIWDIHSDSGPVTLDPITPAPIVIDPLRAGEHRYIEWELITLKGDRPFALNPMDPLEYQLREAGVAQVWVRTASDKFQGEFAGGHAILEVRAIEVEIGRPGFADGPYVVGPGETIELDAIVFNAEDPSLQWSATAGEIEVLGELSIAYTAPLEPAYIVVEAESMSRQGIRASGIPGRSGWAEIIVDGLIIAPTKTCVPLGESKQLRAMYATGDPADFADLAIIEHGSAGHMSGDTFHATNTGTMSIEVFDSDFPDLAATVEFTVREECDTFTATSTGAIAFETNGQCLALFNQTAYFYDGERHIEAWFPRSEIDPLLAGEVKQVEFYTRVSGTIPDAPHPVFGAWGTDWLETGERATVHLTGEWLSEPFYFAEENFLYTTRLFFLNGSISGPVGHIEATADGLIPMESYVTVNFVGLTDAWGEDDLFWGDGLDEFCFDAMPFPWETD